MSIATRIFLGFGVLIALMISIMLFGQYNNRETQKSIQRFNILSDLLLYIHELEREVLNLEMSVMTFAQSGHPAVIKKVEKGNEKISELSTIISEGVQGSKFQDRFEKINSFRSNYMEVFYRFVEDRKNRDELYRVCRDVAAKIMAILNQLKSEEEDYIKSKNAFFLIEKLMMNYLEEPDSSLVREQKVQMDIVKKYSESISAQELNTLVLEFEKNFNELVQSIRGYLFLSNVVLAGQAAEFRFNSSRFRDEFAQDEKNTLNEISQGSQYISNLELFFAVILILLSVLISWKISRSIAVPIGHLTETFADLSRGIQVETIPGLKQKDEIGDMAKAAQVFKEKNRQTEELLASSKMAEEQLQKQTHELERANSELEQFAYVASHDLQEPLRMVASYVQLLAQEYEAELDEEAKEYIGFASEGAKRMQLLINDLLDLSRVGRTETKFEMVDTKDLFDSVCQELRVLIEENQVQIESLDLPSVNAIPRLLQQVMQNFLINAIKYRKKDEVLLFQVSVIEEAESWVFVFKDNGIGIDSRHFDRIFLIFQRLHSRKEYPGSGMGLALVKKIADQHQGKTWVESEVGVGSTFYFSIRKI